eukprot:TRINITY_DN125723_c0_g1_i1.p2 TRINITY_DN125723_c0_g1~~TRINITY_DN125723_c0_g1_i1.p2  ORF type:complete len:263 (+),score=84.81 TRINITY_DN125723_c0_g1_i1:71-859(+)
MAPLSARHRHGDDAAAVVARLQAAGGGKLNFTPVQEVALTPRTTLTTPRSQLATPRPLVRGPQGGIGRLKTVELTPEEEAKVERVFHEHDRAKAGEIDMIEFHAICEALELPLDDIVAKNWLAGRPKEAGLTVEDLKQLYAQILSAQNPAVRSVANRQPLRLREILGAEANIRSAFSRFAKEGTMHCDDLPEVLVYLGFPDVFGDRFDRFVSEWAELRGGGGQVDIHDFVGCMNLLVEFSERHLEEEKTKAVASPRIHVLTE